MCSILYKINFSRFKVYRYHIVVYTRDFETVPTGANMSVNLFQIAPPIINT